MLTPAAGQPPLDPTDREPLHAAIRTTIAGIASAYGCRATLDITALDPVLDNDPGLAAAAARGLTQTDLAPMDFRSCGADDFASYSALMPSLMMFVGTNDGATDAPGLHQSSFVPPDDIISDVATTYLAGLRGAFATLGLCSGKSGDT